MELTEREYFAVEIFKIYYRYLARTPDPEGFLNYYHEVLHGKSLEWVKNQIKSSDEYKKYQ